MTMTRNITFFAKGRVIPDTTRSSIGDDTSFNKWSLTHLSISFTCINFLGRYHCITSPICYHNALQKFDIDIVDYHCIQTNEKNNPRPLSWVLFSSRGDLETKNFWGLSPQFVTLNGNFPPLKSSTGADLTPCKPGSCRGSLFFKKIISTLFYFQARILHTLRE